MSDIDITDQTAIQTELAAIIVEVVGRRSVPIEANSAFDADLGLDSLSMVEIIVAAEERFDVRILDADFAELKTVGQAAAFIAESSAKKAASA